MMKPVRSHYFLLQYCNLFLVKQEEEENVNVHFFTARITCEESEKIMVLVLSRGSCPPAIILVFETQISAVRRIFKFDSLSVNSSEKVIVKMQAEYFVLLSSCKLISTRVCIISNFLRLIRRVTGRTTLSQRWWSWRCEYNCSIIMEDWEGRWWWKSKLIVFKKNELYSYTGFDSNTKVMCIFFLQKMKPARHMER